MIVQQWCRITKQNIVCGTQTRCLIRSFVGSYTSEAKSDKAEKVESNIEDKEESSKDLLNEEVKKLNESMEKLTEKYKRSLAETENVRMRLRKEVGDAKVYGIQSFCKDLLTVADVMRMAVSSIPDEKVASETDKTWKSFYEGVCLTDKELHKVFLRHGLVTVKPTKGDKFNPNEHEALFETPVPNMESGMIAHVERIGYKLRERTLRPAQVGVSSKQS